MVHFPSSNMSISNQYQKITASHFSSFAPYASHLSLVGLSTGTVFQLGYFVFHQLDLTLDGKLKLFSLQLLSGILVYQKALENCYPHLLPYVGFLHFQGSRDSLNIYPYLSKYLCIAPHPLGQAHNHPLNQTTKETYLKTYIT